MILHFVFSNPINFIPIYLTNLSRKEKSEPLIMLKLKRKYHDDYVIFILKSEKKLYFFSIDSICQVFIALEVRNFNALA